MFAGMQTERPRLKKSAFPDQNLPAVPKRGPEKSPKKRKPLTRNRDALPQDPGSDICDCSGADEEVSDPDPDIHNCSEANEENSPGTSRPPIPGVIEEFLSQGRSSSPPVEELRVGNGKKSVPVQVTSGDLLSPFISVVKTDAVINTLSGIPTLKMFAMMAECVRLQVKDRRVKKLSIEERVLLTLMKLKLDLSFSVLAIIFQIVTAQTCKVIFIETLECLSASLRPFIPFPSKAEVQMNMPKCFKNFPNCRVVLDCTEISIQQPKCLKCRIKLYSQYKSTTTVKFLTGVTPGGLLSFISKAYGGRASDKAIFEQSNLLSMLERGDEIMVDRGFLIEDICQQYGVKLIRPAFLKQKKQFTQQEADLSKSIAAARVHIERSNQRIKMFNLFNSKIKWNLVNYIEDAFLVVCAITNLCSPILAEDKFDK